MLSDDNQEFCNECGRQVLPSEGVYVDIIVCWEGDSTCQRYCMACWDTKPITVNITRLIGRPVNKGGTGVLQPPVLKVEKNTKDGKPA
jgi:hypothetical protein